MLRNRMSSAGWVGALMALGLAASPKRGEACGGFFCAQIPVIQTGERILFGVDPDAQTVEAVIQISYQGAAPDFAWLLPLVSEPTEINVGSSAAFLIADQLTSPRFRVSYERSSSCPVPAPSSGSMDAGAVFSADAGAGPGVTVLQRADVGPYESVVLSGTDPAAVRTWLVDNEFFVTDAMMDAVVPYLSQGDVLLALKLKKESTTGDLQPIAVKITSDEPCIPIRLTAIAAQDDMEITALVLSNHGRAIPTNYFHVEPNWVRLNWASGGADYRQLIAAAADEAGGNAFTTEFSGSTQIFSNTISNGSTDVLAMLRAQTTLGGLLQALVSAGLFSRPELSGILTRGVSDEVLTGAGVDPAAFRSCPACWIGQLEAVMFDPGPIAADVEERILAPDRRAQALFDRYGTLTRLYTLLSPAEMSVDPIFQFDTSLPDVSNSHLATIREICDSSGVVVERQLELESGLKVLLGPDGRVVGSDNGAIPAALRIEQLAERRVVLDNTPTAGGPSAVSNREGRDCACADLGTAGGLPMASVLLALGMLVARRRG
ncbi:MAG: DUF2330 domain-containing protein [Deltaproteobacteria bacterium]|nr:DUF2330 domain-containing protein [Deltaproteobacteria bacterium]